MELIMVMMMEMAMMLVMKLIIMHYNLYCSIFYVRGVCLYNEPIDAWILGNKKHFLCQTR